MSLFLDKGNAKQASKMYDLGASATNLLGTYQPMPCRFVIKGKLREERDPSINTESPDFGTPFGVIVMVHYAVKCADSVN